MAILCIRTLLVWAVAVAILPVARLAAGGDVAPGAKDPKPRESRSVGSGASFAQMEQDLLDELNRLRAHPEEFIGYLEEWKMHFVARELRLPGEITLVTNEGVAAVDEAIGFLKSGPTAPSLSRSAGMSKAAADHAGDLGKHDSTGHVGQDGSTPTDRLKRYGSPKLRVAENIAFGEKSGRRVVLQLLVDDGVPGRGHRINFFRPDFKRVGIACGLHPTYGAVCVIDFAGEYVEKS